MLTPKEKPKKITKKQIIAEMIQDNPKITTNEIMDTLKENGIPSAINYINRVRQELGIFLGK